ncbi:TIGR02281 family clan AA aspartic protease [Pseudochrobactrum algeriensis]|uniref:retropepsin-like aspartic protease family protein n=1 Tax=Pseudochrobactrum algeriensis TaxID=2834768 RepID=UPI001BCB8C66|nr:TIGR02281 family clan AA aspartic protease [Pseudochrobactrum algeriensis]QVQ35687.1 TIGR02281 family clan AA aspartic protease [Pseudochrobactrum algeriensis]QVQ38908.1 TIGR02281 family clan AA aspartic protease [Pseudochrobactrum algeriensis]QVQ42821.1 TIGR02281 family clan AA aspartic protease [Pseudochrobactrum algeriensis]
MNRLFWLVIAAIAILLLVLIVNDKSGTTLGLANDDFADAAYMSIFGIVVAAGLLGSGIPLNHMMRNIAIWAVIILGLVTGYQYQYELTNIANRVTAGLIPGNAVNGNSVDGAETVSIGQSANGHFEVNALVNDQRVRFMVDTGASTIVLTQADAEKAGIDVSSLSYTNPVSTANGRTMAASVRLQEIRIGNITRQNLRALVSQEGQLSGSLLGMNFMNSLSAYTVQRDQLILTD